MQVMAHAMSHILADNGKTVLLHQCLNRCAGNPCTLNNLGILCLIDGDSEKARYCFSLAAEDGSGEAAYNLAHFDELSCKW